MPDPKAIFGFLKHYQDLTQEAYSAFKHGKSDEMLEKLETLVPQVESFIKWIKIEKGGRALKERKIKEATE